ncbi:MAG: hypothetical protein H0T53_11495 [Herpetosiphonaceae bacterium]|nr:hypothetical protein [Herpetosiphonaceae bacterium]
MNDLTRELMSLFVYPGLLTMLVLGLLVVLIARLDAPGGGLTRGIAATLTGSGSAALLIAAVAPLVVAAWLPWPGAPNGETRTLGDIWLVWAVLEGSYLLALLPGLQSATPMSTRAAIREAQLGAAGRMALWTALGVAIWAGQTWTLPSLPAHGLALLAALIALPAAVGWGPFAPDNGTTPGGAESELSRAAMQLGQWGRALRATVTLALVPLLALPRMPKVDWGINLALVLVVVLLLASIGRAINGNSVRRPLLDGLHWCFWRALPLAVLAGVVLVAGQRWL